MRRRYMYKQHSDYEYSDMCVPDNFNISIQDVNIISVFYNSNIENKKCVYTLSNSIASHITPNTAGQYYFYERLTNGNINSFIYSANQNINLASGSTHRYILVAGNMTGLTFNTGIDWLFSGYLFNIGATATMIRIIHYIKEYLRQFANQAFFGCTNLTGQLYIPELATMIPASCFRNTRITNDLVLHKNILSLGVQAFGTITTLYGSLIIENPAINGNSGMFNNTNNFTALYLAEDWNSAWMDFSVFTNLSAISLNISIQNIRAGTAGSPKIFTIGPANKTRLLSAFPSAEIEANQRYININ